MRAWFVLLSAVAATAATYEVGPGKLATISDVPWETITAGDTILINWRPEPYRDKWVIGRTGTASSPITVRGVPGPGGELPVIDGRNAVTRRTLNYDNEDRGIIQIGDSAIPRENSPETYPNFIVIENLDIRGARKVPGQSFDYTSWTGRTWGYLPNAAAIFVARGRNITIRNCALHDNGNGLFLAAQADPSGAILIEKNRIYDNGIPGGIESHNVYSETTGVTYQFNYLGPLIAGSQGNNLKDRSAATVVRFNWIEGGNRQLDLVESINPAVRGSANYGNAWVYGNVLIDHPGEDNAQIIHFGGDSSNRDAYRAGTIHIYNNTIVSWRPDFAVLIRLSLQQARADVRNNVYYAPNAREAILLDDPGTMDLRNNWIQSGAKNGSIPAATGTISDLGGNLRGSSPGFAAAASGDFRPTQTSPLLNGGTTLSDAVSGPHPLTYQYEKHASFLIRPRDAVLDIGAFEFGTAAPPPTPEPTGPRSWTIPRLVNPAGGFPSVRAQ